jgi:hypothetical protein
MDKARHSIPTENKIVIENIADFFVLFSIKVASPILYNNTTKSYFINQDMELSHRYLTLDASDEICLSYHLHVWWPGDENVTLLRILCCAMNKPMCKYQYFRIRSNPSGAVPKRKEEVEDFLKTNSYWPTQCGKVSFLWMAQIKPWVDPSKRK